MDKRQLKLSTVPWSQVFRTPTNRATLIITLLLTAVGLIMLYSASYANGIYYYGDGQYYVKRQLMWAALGIVAMFIISYFPYVLMHKLAWLAFLGSYALLALTLAMKPINNAKRWIRFAGVSMQPSELVKFTVILLFAHIMSTHPADQMKTFKYGFLRYWFYLLAIAGVMVMQPHWSGLILIMAIGCAVMWLGGTRIKHFLLGVPATAAAGVAAMMTVEKYRYALKRILTFTQGGDNSADNYQTFQSQIAIGSGGLFGLGLGNSRQKQLYVPYAQNDFIFAIVCEELGFVGAVLIIGMFVALIISGINIALKCKDRFGSLLVAGIMAEIAIQVSFNIAVVSGVFPNTGIALFFFSQGGTALFILLCQIGVVLSVARYNNLKEEEA